MTGCISGSGWKSLALLLRPLNGPCSYAGTSAHTRDARRWMYLPRRAQRPAAGSRVRSNRRRLRQKPVHFHFHFLRPPSPHPPFFLHQPNSPGPILRPASPPPTVNFSPSLRSAILRDHRPSTLDLPRSTSSGACPSDPRYRSTTLRTERNTLEIGVGTGKRVKAWKG